MSVTCSQKEKGSQGNLLYMCTNPTLPFNCQNPQLTYQLRISFNITTPPQLDKTTNSFIAANYSLAVTLSINNNLFKPFIFCKGHFCVYQYHLSWDNNTNIHINKTNHPDFDWCRLIFLIHHSYPISRIIQWMIHWIYHLATIHINFLKLL